MISGSLRSPSSAGLILLKADLLEMKPSSERASTGWLQSTALLIGVTSWLAVWQPAGLCVCREIPSLLRILCRHSDVSPGFVYFPTLFLSVLQQSNHILGCSGLFFKLFSPNCICLLCGRGCWSLISECLFLCLMLFMVRVCEISVIFIAGIRLRSTNQHCGTH